MQTKKRYVRDFVLVVGVLCVCALALFFMNRVKSAGTCVTVISDGVTVGVYSLDTDRVIPVCGTYGNNTVEIRDSKVSVTGADCPDKTCVCMSPISSAGGSLICLPNRLSVTVDGDGVDGIVR